MRRALISLMASGRRGRMALLTMFWQWYIWFVALTTGSIALYQLARRLYLLICGVRAEAEFVRWCRSGMKEPRSSSGCPVVAFVAQDGERYEFRSWVWGNQFGGKELVPRAIYPVLYAPGNPKNALIYTAYSFWMPPLLFLGLCAFVVAMIWRGIPA